MLRSLRNKKTEMKKRTLGVFDRFTWKRIQFLGTVLHGKEIPGKTKTTDGDGFDSMEKG